MQHDEYKSLLEIFLGTPPISGDISTTGKYNFPQLAQVNCLPEEPVYPLNYLKSTLTKGSLLVSLFHGGKKFSSAV